MPYQSITEARDAKFPVTLDGADLTLTQINKLAELYDAIKADSEVKKPMGVAIAQFYELYVKKGDAWVLREKLADTPTMALTPRFESEPKVLAKVGLWKGVRLTAERLKRIADNYLAIAKHGLLPKHLFGHDRDHRAAKALGFRFVDGWPDLGSVVKCWFDEATGTLWGIHGQMPQLLAEKINAEQYTDVSIEIEPEWWDDIDKVMRRDVMRFVGFLGVQWPGVKGMGDHLTIAAQMADEGPILPVPTHAYQLGEETVFVQSIRLSEITDDQGGETDMADEKELTEKVAALEAKVAEFAGNVTIMETLCAEFGVQTVTELPEAVKAFKAKAAEAETKVELAEQSEREVRAKATEARIDATLAQAAREGKVPAGRIAQEKAILMAMDYDPARTLKFADGDKEVEGSELDRGLAAVKDRLPVIRMSEQAAAEGKDEHKAPIEVDPLVRKAAEGMGFVLNDKGEWVEPSKKD